MTILEIFDRWWDETNAESRSTLSKEEVWEYVRIQAERELSKL